MKIRTVTPNNRKKVFEVQAGGRTLSYPYAKLGLRPSTDNLVVEAYPDPDTGREAFTYVLESGEEDTVHVDAVLEYNQDPTYLHELLVHQLAMEARKAVQQSDLAKRELCRRLGTSPSQLYRVLDPSRAATSVGHLLAILHVLGREVEVSVRPKQDTPAHGPRRSLRRVRTPR